MLTDLSNFCHKWNMQQYLSRAVWGPFQYPRYVLSWKLLKKHQISIGANITILLENLWDLSHQQHCIEACQISEQVHKSHTSETSWDLSKRDLTEILKLPEINRWVATTGNFCRWLLVNSSPPGQNGCHFADDIFRCIFMKENFYVLIKISLKFFPKGPIDIKPSIGLDNGLTPNRRQAII